MTSTHATQTREPTSSWPSPTSSWTSSEENFIPRDGSVKRAQAYPRDSQGDLSDTACRDRLSEALGVVLATGWISGESSKQLRVTSLGCCIAFREATSVHLCATDETPTRVWPGASDEKVASRVPPLRIKRLTLRDTYVNVGRLPPSLQSITFPQCFNEDLSNEVLPAKLQHLEFGCHFNQPLNKVLFPAGLVSVTFGCRFDRAIDGVAWNPDLRAITFDVDFNKPLEGVALPSGLRVLKLGYRYDRPLGNVGWPPRLEQLDLGHHFNHPLGAPALLPSSLRVLQLGPVFNQPIAGIHWPPLLKEMYFGYVGRDVREFPGYCKYEETFSCLDLSIEDSPWEYESFNQPLDDATLPPLLEVLSLGEDFDQPLTHVQWPTTLKTLYIGNPMDQGRVLEAVVPKVTLETLVVGGQRLVDGGVRVDRSD